LITMRYCLLLLSLLASLRPYAQDFVPPLGIPLRLTGNFGELRNNHFHAGLDIATDQTTGLPVYACAEGYVSRIVVGPNGYGKALYLTHPNGLTTVYGHLEAYGEGIAQYVRAQQYEREQFELDLALAPNTLLITKGQVVAKSGNTGASAGPHLHFEVRRGDTPLNPLACGFTIADSRPPELSHLYAYPYWDGFPAQAPKSYALTKVGTRWQPAGGVIRVPGRRAGLALYAWDRQDGRENRNGVYRMEMLLDGKPHFRFQMDSLPYAKRRYLNAHLDYRLNMESQRKVHRLFKLPGNGLGIYSFLPGEGLLELGPGVSHEVEIRVYDYSGNLTTVAFRVQSDSLGKPSPKPYQSEVAWADGTTFEADGIRMELAEGSLYEDLYLNYGQEKGSGWSDKYRLGDSYTPIHREATISIRANKVPERYRDKALVVNVDDAGRRKTLGGTWVDGYMQTKSDKLGEFYVMIDSVAPVVNSVNLKAGQWVGPKARLSFKISDNLSGIKSYRGEIDGHWVLFEYEPKNSLLYHDLEGTLEPGRHVLVLLIKDERGNSTERRIAFTR